MKPRSIMIAADCAIIAAATGMTKPGWNYFPGNLKWKISSNAGLCMEIFLFATVNAIGSIAPMPV